MKEIMLHGVKDKSKYRPLGGAALIDHTFNFEYISGDKDKKTKRYDNKNAKPPQHYINRPCFKCSNKPKCKKCQNGIFALKFSKKHFDCNGKGCDRCNHTGKYPSQDILCFECKGKGIIDSSNCPDKKRRGCINGYRLPRLIQFKPKGSIGKGINSKDNVMRLYHVTDENGARGIQEDGVMYRGQNGSYGGAIYFADNGVLAMERARNKGYLVIADVFVGKSKFENKPNVDMTYDKLRQEGYDSIKGNWSDKEGMSDEYVVYNWSQVWVHIVLPANQLTVKQLRG